MEIPSVADVIFGLVTVILIFEVALLSGRVSALERETEGLRKKRKQLLADRPL
jgi:hypothetical protein